MEPFNARTQSAGSPLSPTAAEPPRSFPPPIATRDARPTKVYVHCGKTKREPTEAEMPMIEEWLREVEDRKKHPEKYPTLNEQLRRMREEEDAEEREKSSDNVHDEEPARGVPECRTQ